MTIGQRANHQLKKYISYFDEKEDDKITNPNPQLESQTPNINEVIRCRVYSSQYCQFTKPNSNFYELIIITTNCAGEQSLSVLKS